MVVGVFGVPSKLTHLGAQIVQAILAQAFGSCEIVAAQTVEDVVKSLAGRGLKSAILFNEYPDPLLVTLLAEENVPIILFLNSFPSTVRELIKTFGLPLVDAVQTATLCFSAIDEAIIHQPLILRCESIKTAFRELIGSITGFLQMPSLHGQSEALYSLIPGEAGQGDAHRAEPDSSADNTSEDAYERQLKPFSSYDAVLSGQTIDEVVWPAGVFRCADQNSAFADLELELTGPARFLIYGPYMALPRGTWIARPMFYVTGNHSGNSLIIDIGASNRILALGRCDLPTNGRFSCEMPFPVAKPSLALEVRFQIGQGAIEGKLCLDRVCFQRFQSPHP